MTYALQTARIATIDDACTLSIGDFRTLAELEMLWSERGHKLLYALRMKLRNARVVAQEEMPREVATIASQVDYTIDRGELETRALTTLAIVGPRWLPVQLATGLAILGRNEGQTFSVSGCLVHLHRVFDQPEASWPERFRHCEPPRANSQMRILKDRNTITRDVGSATGTNQRDKSAVIATP